MQTYPNLFKPIEISTQTISNRVVMGSMHTGLEDQFWNYPKLGSYFAERVKGGGPGLVITGGISPNREGRLSENAGKLSQYWETIPHRWLTRAVHQQGGKVCMQILHAGRYAKHTEAVAPSPIKAPINQYRPNELTETKIKKQIDDFVRCAELAKKAGYDGIEIMGSEGYFINQFLCTRTNQRNDQWGGTYKNRKRFALDIVRKTRKAVGERFLMIFRLSVLDLVEEGSSWSEIVSLAKDLEHLGVDIINCGIGWHEARIPTIASNVPPGAFSNVVKKLHSEISVPIIATNRINTPELAEALIADGVSDFVSMARPLLADPKFVHKARQGKSEEINTCIGCNQACLDQIFSGKNASCLVNPDTLNNIKQTSIHASNKKNIAVIGAGPAGLAAAAKLAKCGHQVTLFEAKREIGGQFNLAKMIPGKEDYSHTIRYYQSQLDRFNVTVKLGMELTEDNLHTHIGSHENHREGRFDEVILSTGVLPRSPQIPGIHNNLVMGYTELLEGKRVAGERVAIIGAGGIGFDVAVFLLTEGRQSVSEWHQFWGIDPTYEARGALTSSSVKSKAISSGRQLTLLQRTPGGMGKTLGKTTGWAHKIHLKKHGIKMLSGVTYDRIEETGIHISIDTETQFIELDNIVICAGQEAHNSLIIEIEKTMPRAKLHVIGGAERAGELDAQRAIAQGEQLAASMQDV